MNDLWQYIVVGIVVAIAFLLAARSVYRAMTHKKSALVACDSCKLKEPAPRKDNHQVTVKRFKEKRNSSNWCLLFSSMGHPSHLRQCFLTKS